MDTLIQSITSFLNLSKLTAVTVPGMVVAFALILVLGPIPCRDNSKSCPFCSDTLKPVAVGGKKLSDTGKPQQAMGPTAPSAGNKSVDTGNTEPATGPTAHFTMNGQTQTVSDPGTLTLNLATDASVPVKFVSTSTQGSALITGYVWKSNGTQICSNFPSCTYPFSTPSNTITLTVTDASGKTSTAQGNTTAPLTLSPTSLNFVTGSDGKAVAQQVLTLTNTGKSDLSSIKASISGTDQSRFRLDETLCSNANPLPPASNCIITVRYTRRTFDPYRPLDPLRPSSAVTFAAILSVSAVDKSSGSDQPVKATASLAASPESASPSEASNVKQIGNTVITSKATWLNSGSDSTVAADRGILLENLEHLLVHPELFKDEIKSIKNSCKYLPLYVVPNSRPTSDKSDEKTTDGGKNKPGTPQYAGETTTSVEDVLSICDECNASLTKLDESLQAMFAKKQTIIAQDTTDLTALSSSLVAAQNNANRLVERDLQGKVAQKKDDLQKEQEYSKSLSQADSYVATLISQVTATRNAAYSQATPAPAAQDASKTSVVADVFLTIQQNFLKFLLFSLIIGAIFDPIQRALLSYVGPRRDVFSVFNRVYGQKGDGEIRYGDRRLPPWTTDKKFLLLPETPKRVLTQEEMEEREALRYSPADFAFRRNMNIYDQNYAIGAGYISQSEFNSIYNEFFTQSQMTSGLILPMLILSVCIGMRFICCARVSVVGPGSWWLIFAVCGAIYIGILSGLLGSHFVSSIGSSEYAKIYRPLDFLADIERVFIDFFKIIKPSDKKEAADQSKNNTGSEGKSGRDRRNRIVLLGILLLLASVLLILANDDVLGLDVLPIIALPSVFLIPLWVAGLDRLHKFYSELQARIAGNILRLQESTQQKMVDLITHDESLGALQDSLGETMQNIGVLSKFVEQYKAHLAEANASGKPKSQADPPTATGGKNLDTAGTPSNDPGDSS